MTERSARTASVLLPVFQGAQFLDRVLDALAGQRTSASWDFLALDCGSTDGTLEILARRARDFPVPLRVESLGAERFDHADTRNILASLSTGEILVFITDDAIPADERWLDTLLANFDDPEVGAVYCRNVPRPDASPLARVASEDNPNYSAARRVQRLPDRQRFRDMEPDALRALFAMNDTASAHRRELWERHPYPRSSGEDVLLARALIEAGYTVVYDERACVLHTHDWPAERFHARGVSDGEFQAEWLGRVCFVDEREVERRTDIAVARDREALRRIGCDREETEREANRSRELWRTLYAGILRGGASARRYPPSAILDDPSPPVLILARSGDERAEKLARSLREKGYPAAIAPAGDLSAALATARAALRAEPSVLHVFLDSRELDHARWPEALASLPAVVEHDGGWLLVTHGTGSLGDDTATELARDPVMRIGYRETSKVDLARDRRFDAAVWISRYRELACRAGPVALDRWGRDARVIEGEVRRQGAVGVLLGPEPATIAVELPRLARGEWVVELSVKILGSERSIGMAGRILADGREIGRTGPLSPRGADEIVTIRASLPAAGARRIEIDNRDPGARHLRVHRIAVRRANVETPAERTWSRREDARRRALLEQLASLEVPAPPAVGERDLPTVAVIVPTLVGRELLQRSLASIAASDYPSDRVRVVVVDNGSPGDTASWLRSSHPRVEIVRNETNLGFTRAVNQGAQAAEGARVFAFVNDDVELEPGCLRALVTPIAAQACACTAGRMLDAETGAAQFAGGGSSLQGIALSLPPGEDEGPPRRRRALFACGGAMAVDAGAFHAVGGFDEEMFAYYDDLDLGWRLWIAGYEVHSVPDAVCRHARSSTSSRFAPEKVRLLQTRNALLCCIKNYDDANLARLLPALIALHVQRARVMAGPIDERAFRIEHAPKSVRKRAVAWLRRALSPRTVPISRMAMADLIALDDVLGALPHWLERRAAVQALRRRPDAEILRLFLDPMRCHEGDLRYIALQRTLTEWFDLGSIFGEKLP